MVIGFKEMAMKIDSAGHGLIIAVFILSLLCIVIIIISTFIDSKIALLGLVGLGFFIFLMIAPLFWLAILLIMLMPYHYLISGLLGGYASDSRQVFALWKDLLIFAGLFRAFIENPNRMIILKANRWLFFFAGALVAVYVITFFRLPSIPAIFSLNLETRFLGVLTFFLLIPLTKKRSDFLLQLMVLGVGVVAAYGIVQYYWDYERLIHLVNYVPGVFSEGNKRVYSICLNPFDPAYGAVIGILVVLSICFRHPTKWLWGLPVLMLLGSCLILTYTRSGYICLIMGVFTLVVMDLQHFRRYLFPISIGIWLIIAILLLGGDSLFQSNFGKRLDTIASLKDESSMIHKERMKAAFRSIRDDPWGIGLGKFGNVQARFQGGTEKAEYSENWILQVGVQTGLIGALIYIFLNLSVLVSLLRRRIGDLKGDDYLRVSASGVFVAMTVAGIMIPVWDFLLTMVYTWAMVGLALQTSRFHVLKEQA